MMTLLRTLAARYGKYALITLGVVLVAWFLFGRNTGPAGPTLTVARADFTKIVNVSGTVIAARDVDLGFASNGRLSGVYARVGAHVGAGAVLAETDNGDLAAAVTQKQAALAKAEAELASLEAGTRPEEVAVAAADVASAEAALVSAIQSAYTSADDAVRNRTDAFIANPRTTPALTFSLPNSELKTSVEFDRTDTEAALSSWATELTDLSTENADKRAVTAQSYLARITRLLADANAALNQAVPDQNTSVATLSSYATSLATARTNVSAAATTVSTDLAALNSKEKTLVLKQAGSTSDDVAAKRAAVASARADVANARAALAKTRVLAPFSGIVTRMDAKVGEIVSPSTSLISMQSDGLFQLETYVPEVSIAEIAVGALATTTLDAYGSGTPFTAKVVAVDPAETVKDGVPTYKTVLTFLAPDNRIRSGMTADVRIVTGTLPDAIVIPGGAVGKGATGDYVSVVSEKEVTQRFVETRPAALGQVEVISGLSGGETILTTPQAY